VPGFLISGLDGVDPTSGGVVAGGVVVVGEVVGEVDGAVVGPVVGPAVGPAVAGVVVFSGPPQARNVEAARTRITNNNKYLPIPIFFN
jgi:hypothetical protein